MKKTATVGNSSPPNKQPLPVREEPSFHTGTAEIGSKNNRRQNTWFIAFVKHNNRTYAAALVIQDGQSGGMTCAPVMAEFLEYYLDSKTDAQ